MIPLSGGLLSNTNTSDPIGFLESPYNKKWKAETLQKEKFVLCISHYEEDLSWLVSLSEPFVIASKTLPTIYPNHVLSVPNTGNEVTSYLLYIIQYYDALPEYTLFLHGHDTSWHQFYSIQYIVHVLKTSDTLGGYVNINNYLVNDRNSTTNKYMKQLSSLWLDLFETELGPMPSRFREKCCAQFVVHRSRILSHPLEFYRYLTNHPALFFDRTVSYSA